jgi:probable F420-dependent oxidoreductase
MMDLGRLGVWWSGSWRGEDGSTDIAAELESLGYRALWSSGRFDPGISKHFERLISETTRLVVASGIISIWVNDPGELSAAFDELDNRHPGRFLLGLGVSHSPMVQDYARPFSRMVGFLDALNVDPERRVLAALAPRMLELAAERSSGAHPYFVPAEHTARAREILGPDALLAPEVTVVLEPDPSAARDIARSFTTGYLGLTNYAGNLRSLGFSEEDLAGGGSDRLVDAVVCWGDAETVAGKVRRHYEAGADHVCIQVLPDPRNAGGAGAPSGFPIAGYRELAPAILGQ